MTREYVHEIHLRDTGTLPADDDDDIGGSWPIVLDKPPTEDGIGVRFSAGEARTVRIPWGNIAAVLRVPRSDDDGDYDDPTEGALVPPGALEPPAGGEGTGEPVKGDSGDQGAKSDAGSDAGKGEKVDTKVSKAKEWANDDPAAIRAWAKENGVAVSESGPIPKATLAKYAAAKSS